MTEVVIRNKDMLEVLNGFSKRCIQPSYNDEKYWTYHERKDIDLGLTTPHVSICWIVSLVMSFKACRIGTSHNRFRKWCEKIRRCGETSCRRSSMTLRQNFSSYFCITLLLSAWRFVGWHTNYDANAYQVLFTWSETGEGFFEYYDKQKDEIVKIEDVPGQQCRHYYFGAGDEPDLHWHAAYTECQRITLAYKFVNNGSIHTQKTHTRQLRDY